MNPSRWLHEDDSTLGSELAGSRRASSPVGRAVARHVSIAIVIGSAEVVVDAKKAPRKQKSSRRRWAERRTPADQH